MDHILDIFNGDAFNVVSLTDRINRIPFVPGQVGELGIFEEGGVDTDTVAIQEASGTLSLVPSKPRGAPPTQIASPKSRMRKLTIPHLPVEGHVLADEVRNVRPWGSETMVGAVQRKVDEEMAIMVRDLDLTIEYQRISALQGLLLDSDGSTVIYDLFDEFDVNEQTEDYELSNEDLDVLQINRNVIRKIRTALGVGTFRSVMVYAGEEWFDEYVSHAAIKEAYRFYQVSGVNQNANPFRDNLVGQTFEFGGIRVQEYRGSVNGVDFIPTSEARAFPIGVPGLYRTYFAPADYIETVGTLGLPRYAKQERMRFDKGIDFEGQSNPLSFVTKPDVLIKLTKS